MMKRSFFYLLLTFFSLTANAQQYGYKYWEMRQRFLDKFIRVGEGHGMSIPASWVTKKISGADILEYEDESPRHLGWYIAVLATEHKLLELQGQSTTQNEMELYYALKAINRLDGHAEFLYKADFENQEYILWDENTHEYKKTSGNTQYTDYTGAQLNGFMIREDVPPDFGQLFPNETYEVQHQLWEDGWIVDNVIQNKKKTVISQDQFYHLMFGLSFLKKYIPSTCSYNGMNFLQEAKDICSRVMIAYNGTYQLINAVTGYPVEDLDEENIGDSWFYSWFVATMANWFVNDVNYFSLLPTPGVQDLANPFFKGICAVSKSIWFSTDMLNLSSTIVANTGSTNQIMALLLLSMSDAYNGHIPGTRNFLNLPPWEFQNPGYRFYATAYRLFHDRDIKIGYSRAEMEFMLQMMTCEGPHWYSNCQTFHIQPSQTYNELQYNEVLPYIQANPHEQATLTDEKDAGGNITGISYCWHNKSNPVWNRDNIFVQPPFNQHDDIGQNGHYNAIDYMLLYNVYQLLVYEEAKGFKSDDIGDLLEDVGTNTFCGHNCELHGTLPVVFQDDDEIRYLDLNPFNPGFGIETFTRYGTVHEIGTPALPYIRTSTGTIQTDQKFKTFEMITYLSVPVDDTPPVINLEFLRQFKAQAYFRAIDEVVLLPGFDAAAGTHVTVETGPDNGCTYYAQRLDDSLSGSSKLRYEVFHRSPDSSGNKGGEITTSAKLYPNPATNHISLNLQGRSDKPLSIIIYDMAGRALLSFDPDKVLYAPDEYNLQLDRLVPGAYICSVVYEEKVANKTFIKL